MSILRDRLLAAAKRPVLIISALYVILLIFFFQAGLYHDAFQYYAYTSSMTLDGDLDMYDQLFLNNEPKHHNPFPEGSARYIGTSVLEMPALAAGHIVCSLFNAVGFAYPANGYSLPYMFFVSLFSSLAGFAGLLLLFRLCLRHFSQNTSLLVALIIMAGSPLMFFMTCWNGWPHTYSFLFVTAFLLYWDSTRGDMSPARFAVLGTMLGMIIIIRPPDGIILLFLAAELFSGAARSARILRPLSVFILTAALTLSPQLLIWKLKTGSWLASPYGEVGDYFDFLNPHLFQFLFSVPQHGLFVWSPVLLLALPGLFFLITKEKTEANSRAEAPACSPRNSQRVFDRINRMFRMGKNNSANFVHSVKESCSGSSCLGMSALLAVCVFVYVNSSWSAWWTGIGYSNRFVIGILPVLALAIGALYERLASSRFFRPALGLTVLLLLWNAVCVNAYRFNYIPQGIPDPFMYPQELDMSGFLSAPIAGLLSGVLDFVRGRFSGEPFFLSRFCYSIYNLCGSELLFASVALVLAVASAFLIIRSLRGRRSVLMRRAAIGAGSIIVLCVVADALIIFSGLRKSASTECFRCPFPGAVELDSTRNKQAFTVDYPVPAGKIHLVTTLTRAHSLPNNAPVAEVTVSGMGGIVRKFTLAAGRDTAESSYLRREHSRDIRHTIALAKPVRSTQSRVGSRSSYSLLWYLAELDLAEPVAVTKVSVRYLQPQGSMLISEVLCLKSSAALPASYNILLPGVPASRFQPIYSTYLRDFVRVGADGVYAAASDGGLQFYDAGGRLTGSMTSRDGLPSDRITCLLDDAERLWVGTSDGLAVTVGGCLTDTMLEGRIIYSLAKDNAGNVYAGTDRGAFIIKAGRVLHVDPPNDLARRRVFSIYPARDGSVWFGLENGLVRLVAGNRWQTFQNNPFLHVTTNCLPDNCIYSVSGDAAGNVWVGTAKGLARFDGVNWRAWHPSGRPDSILSDSVRAVAVDGKDVVWIGYGNSGPRHLSAFDGKSWRHYGESTGIKCDEVSRIRINSSGDKLLSTDWGAVVITDKGARYFVHRETSDK